MIASTYIAHTEIFEFIAVLVLQLLSREVLLTNRKDNRNHLNVGYFFKK